LAAVAILSIGAAVSRAEVEPPQAPIEVLKSSLGNPPNVTYSGERTQWYQKEDGTKSVFSATVMRTADGRERTELRRDGETVRIALRGGDTSYVWSKEQGWRREARGENHEEHRWDNIELVSKNYKLSREDIYYLQRRCIAVRSSALFPGRPELKVIVDAETMVALELEVIRPGGRESFGYRFERISFDKFDESVFDPAAECADEPKDGKEVPAMRSFKGISEAKGSVAFEVVAPTRLPAGFTFTGCAVGQEGHWGRPEEQVMMRLSYGDGLSVISIYLRGPGEGGGGDAKFTEVRRDGRSVMWAPHYRNILLTTAVGETRAAIFGEIPLEELLDMSFSIAPAG
jgi:hypothetical protein